MLKRLAILASATLSLAVLSSAQPRNDGAQTARSAVEKVLPLLQESARTWSTRAGCFSCHHQGLGATTVALAREAGYRIEETLLAEEVSNMKRLAPRPDQSVLFGANSDFEGLASTYLLIALAANRTPPDLKTAALVSRMLGRQSVTGYWVNSGPRRLPIQGSHFTETALTLRAIRLYAPEGRKGDAALHLQRGCGWLRAAEPGDTEDAAMQLLGLAWCQADESSIVRAKERLIAKQRPDGGWAQNEFRESDSYATGQALVALNQAGRLLPSAQAFRNGVAYLLRTQKPDGTWLVETRRTWREGLPYLESGFPHGKHQFVSYAATAWATMALILSSRDHVSNVLMGQPSAASKDAEGRELTPLMRAALLGTSEDFRRELKAAANVNEQSSSTGITALMCAVHDPQRVKLLLAAGAAVNTVAKTGHTALLLAADTDGAVESLRMLLDSGADIKARAGRTFTGTLLARAAFRGDRESIATLIGRGAVLNDLPKGSAAMVVAAHDGDAELIAFLLDHGADIETTSRLGREPAQLTSLMFAADSGGVSAVNLLLAKGANVNARDSGGLTPLFYAVGALDRQMQIVDALIRAGADLQARSQSGETALDFAGRYGNTEAADVIRKALAAPQRKR